METRHGDKDETVNYLPTRCIRCDKDLVYRFTSMTMDCPCCGFEVLPGKGIQHYDKVRECEHANVAVA
jgi:predicted RNA-binding Zn-ribbon protein involved in translation (DUF1610 family)